MRDFQKPGRSTLYASNAAASTSHPLATLAAISMLQDGGNAVDAALAASAVLTVAEPQMTGMGGDCFAILASSDGRIEAINGSGRAGAAMTIEALGDVDEIGMNSPHAVTIPGAVAAWQRLADEKGRFGLDRVLAPAIGYAEAGIPTAPRVAYDWAKNVDGLKADKGARRHYLIGDQAPVAGDLVTYPALARAMKEVAEKGAAGFYQGWVADDLVSTLQGLGGLQTLDDFAAAQADWVRVSKFAYRDHEMIVFPPNTQALSAAMILAQMEHHEADRDDPLSPRRAHIYLEAVRRSYAVRSARIGDPTTMSYDVDHLLSPSVLDQVAGTLDPTQVSGFDGAMDLSGTHTVYLTVVDEDGLCVSFINSLFHNFGSKIVGQKSGVALHNRGASFRLDPAHPNALAPGKRPMHTLIPGMVLKDGLPVLSYGVMGGAYQAAGHAWFLSNVFAHRMGPQEALELPRCFVGSDQAPVGSPSILEGLLADRTGDQLSLMGHDVERSAEPIGCGQGIMIDRKRGVLIAGADHRKDSVAMGY